MEIQPPPEYTFSDCFTYSPNWYIQSTIFLSPSDKLLYYCSNSLLYILDLTSYKVINQIQCRQILKQKQYPLQTVESAKANSVFASEKTIIVGMNEGILLVLGKHYQVLDIVNTKMKSIYAVVEVNREKKEYLLVDDSGCCGLVKLDSKQFAIKIQKNKERVKKVARIGDSWVVFYQNGQMYLFNEDFSKQIRKFKFFKNQLILSIDVYQSNILILSKNDEDLVITYCQFNYGHEVPLEQTKTLYEMSKNVFRCSIAFNYHKKYQYKQKDMRKACLTIKWLSCSSFILSGKVGQLYIFDTKNCLDKKKIQLKPFSHLQEENTGYQVVSDSHHFEDIYAIYKNQNIVLTIGTDRCLTFWKYLDNILNYQYQIKFLASKVRSIFKSESERNNCFLLMENFVIRSWDVESHINGQGLMNQYWKLSNKTKIERIVSCPNEQGIVAVLGNQNKILLYDLHQERVIKEISVEDDTKHLGFANSTIVKSLCLFLEHQPYEVHISQKQYFQRTFSKDCYLVMYDKNYISFLNLQSKTCQRLGKFFQQMINTEFVEDFFFFEGVIVSIIKSPTTFNFYVFSNNKRSKKFQFGEQFINNKYYVRILNNERIILSLWRNKDINLFLFDISSEQIKIIKTGHCTFNYNINYSELSPNGQRLLCYSNLNSTLQIWQLNWNQEEKLKTVSKNIKAHQSYVSVAAFWGNRYAISCSYDQNVKVWDCDLIPERAPPKGTKIKKKKKKMEVQGKQKQQSSNKNTIKQSSDSSDEEQLANKK